jgi:hypothetical protein
MIGGSLSAEVYVVPVDYLPLTEFTNRLVIK